MILYPNCSTFVGRFDGTAVRYNKNGDEVKGHEADFSISTDSFPNGGVETMIKIVEHGKDLDDLDLKNSGGGADTETLERSYCVAYQVVNRSLPRKFMNLYEEIAWDAEKYPDVDEAMGFFIKIKNKKFNGIHRFDFFKNFTAKDLNNIKETFKLNNKEMTILKGELTVARM